MAWIIFAVIAGLSLFQFWQARQFYLADMAYDCIWRFIVGAFCSVVAFMFGLGVLLG